MKNLRCIIIIIAVISVFSLYGILKGFDFFIPYYLGSLGVWLFLSQAQIIKKIMKGENLNLRFYLLGLIIDIIGLIILNNLTNPKLIWTCLLVFGITGSIQLHSIVIKENDSKIIIPKIEQNIVKK